MEPLAYFFTFRCYGTVVHGENDETVDREHNRFGTAYLPRQPQRAALQRQLMNEELYLLDTDRRKLVRAGIEKGCRARAWTLHALHVRTTHVHAVVTPDVPPERALGSLKAWASRELAVLDRGRAHRWAYHGSTRYLWTEGQLQQVARYVIDGQGFWMECVFAPGLL